MAAVSQEAIPRQQETDATRQEGTYQPHPRRSLGSVIKNMSWSDRIGAVVGTATMLTIGGAAAEVVLPGASTNPEQPPAITVPITERQTPYPETKHLTESDIENKYSINIVTEKDALAQLGIANEADPKAPTEWTQAQLHLLDQDLANLPPSAREKINGHEVSFALGGINDIKGGDCSGVCDGMFMQNYNDGGGLIILGPNTYKPENEIGALRMFTHEDVGHREDYATNHATKPAIEKILGDLSSLHLDQIKATNDYTTHVIEALKSFAGGDSNLENPHQIFVEGVAETAALYVQGKAAFIDGYGQFIGKDKAEALYNLYKTEFFDRFQFNDNREMITTSIGQATESDVEQMLINYEYMDLFSYYGIDKDPSLSPDAKLAVQALKDLYNGQSDPDLFLAGISDALTLYKKGYLTFMNAFGPAVDTIATDNDQIQSYDYYTLNPVAPEDLPLTFPDVDAFYNYLTTNFFSEASATPTPVVIGDETIGTISNGRITSINRGPTPK